MAIDWDRELSDLTDREFRISHYSVRHDKHGYFIELEPPEDFRDPWNELIRVGGEVHSYWDEKKNLTDSDYILGELSDNKFIFILPRKHRSGNRTATIIDTWVCDSPFHLLDFLSDKSSCSSIPMEDDDIGPHRILESSPLVWQWSLLGEEGVRNVALCPENLSPRAMQPKRVLSTGEEQIDLLHLTGIAARSVYSDVYITGDGGRGRSESMGWIRRLKLLSERYGFDQDDTLMLYLLDKGHITGEGKLNKGKEVMMRRKLGDRSGAFDLILSRDEVSRVWIDASRDESGNGTFPLTPEERDRVMANFERGKIGISWFEMFQQDLIDLGYQEKVRLSFALWILSIPKLEIPSALKGLGNISITALLGYAMEIKPYLSGDIGPIFYRFLEDLEGGSVDTVGRRSLIDALMEDEFVDRPEEIIQLSNYLGRFLADRDLLETDLSILSRFTSFGLLEAIAILNAGASDLNEVAQRRVVVNLGAIRRGQRGRWGISEFLPNPGLAGDYPFLYPILAECAQLSIEPPADCGQLRRCLSPNQFLEIASLEQQSKGFIFLRGDEPTLERNGWTYPGYFEFASNGGRKEDLIQLSKNYRVGRLTLARTFKNSLLSLSLGLMCTYLLLTLTVLYLHPHWPLTSPSSASFFRPFFSASFPLLFSVATWYAIGHVAEISDPGGAIRSRMSKWIRIPSIVLFAALLVNYVTYNDLSFQLVAPPSVKFEALFFDFQIPSAPVPIMLALVGTRLVHAHVSKKIKHIRGKEEDHRRKVADVLSPGSMV